MNTERLWDRIFQRNIVASEKNDTDVNFELEKEWPGGERWFTRFLKPHIIHGGATICEIGPGTGRITQWCRPLSQHYYLVDYSEFACEFLRGEYPGSIVVQPEDCNIDSIPGDSCDLFFSLSVFEHLFEEQVYIYMKQAYRVLKKKGILVLHFRDLRNAMFLFLKHFPNKVDSQRCVFRFLHPDYARSFAVEIGFREINIEFSENTLNYFLTCKKLS